MFSVRVLLQKCLKKSLLSGVAQGRLPWTTALSLLWVDMRMLETLALQLGDRGTPEGGVPVCEPPVHSWDFPALGAQPVLGVKGAAFLMPTLCFGIGAHYHTLRASGGSGPGPLFSPGLLPLTAFYILPIQFLKFKLIL